MAAKTKPLLTFVIYISRSNLPTHIEEFLSSVTYLNEKPNIQLIFVNANNDEGIVNVIKNYESELNIFYFKISSDLGQSYAYNLAIPYIKGKYCHFISPTYTFEPKYFEVIRKNVEKNTICSYLVMLYNPHALNNYELKNLTYKGLSDELILGLNSNLKYCIVNSEFLLNSKINFQDFTFHPFTFVANLLVKAHLISYIPTQLIKSSFKPINCFNAYDILYQAYDILTFLNEKGVYEKYINEWNYLLIVNIYHVFLKVLARSYDIDVNSKNSIKENFQLLNSAIVSIKSIVNKLNINVNENKYVKANEASIFEIYNKIVKVVK